LQVIGFTHSLLTFAPGLSEPQDAKTRRNAMGIKQKVSKLTWRQTTGALRPKWASGHGEHLNTALNNLVSLWP